MPKSVRNASALVGAVSLACVLRLDPPWGRSRLPVQDELFVVEHAVADVSGGREAGVVDVVDVIAGDGVAARVGALAITASLVVPAVGAQFLADETVRGHPHADVGVRVECVVAVHGPTVSRCRGTYQVTAFLGVAHPPSYARRQRAAEGGGSRMWARSGGMGVSGRKNGAASPSGEVAGASARRKRFRRRP